MNAAELEILLWIRESLTNPFLDVVMPVITFLGDAGWFWIATAVVLLFFKKTRKTGIMMGVALICGLVIGNLFLKPVIARDRPFELLSSINLLIDPPHDRSFPSGHTLASFEGAVVLFMRTKKYIGIPALVLAFAIAFSRLYLFVHFPTDVLAGMVLGTAFALLSVWGVEKVWKSIQSKKKAKAE